MKDDKNSNFLVLRSRKSGYLKSLLSSAIFTALSVKLASAGAPAAGWILAVFFGLAAISSLIPLLPNQSYLSLDIEGFTIKSMFKTIRIEWNDVRHISPVKRNRRHVVSFIFKEDSPRRRNYLNLENLVGKREVLPDNYGLKPAALAKLMEDFRKISLDSRPDFA